jgi:hypothetical protein
MALSPMLKLFAKLFERYMSCIFRRRQLGVFTITLVVTILLIGEAPYFRLLHTEVSGQMSGQRSGFT